MSGVIDVAVVGAGPAGLAAALAAGDLGCEVTLIDAGIGPGGQMYRPGMLFPGSGRARRAAEHLPPGLARIRQVRLVRQLAATTVWQAARDHDGVVTLGVGAPEGGAETTVEVRAVVLATGAAELVLPFPGWDLPGVTTAGAAHALLTSQGVTVGRRVLVGGSGPLLLPVAASLAQAGVRVVAVLEAAPISAALPQAAGLAAFPGQLPEASGYAAILARHGVPVRTGYAVVACQGTERVERAVIARLDRDWRPLPGTRREEPVDAVHVSFGFAPALELSRALGCAEVQHTSRPAAAVACDADLATSVPGVFAAGEVTGAGGADVAELEGYLAGTSAARYLSRLPPDAYAERTRPLRARLENARRLAARLDEAFPLPPGWLEWPDASTIICRCEETRWSEIGAAVDGGARDVRTVKEVTRCGMGDCRARVCGPALQYAVSAAAARPLTEAARQPAAVRANVIPYVYGMDPSPEVIYIIRHAEKPLKPPLSGVDYKGSQNEHSLLPRGWQRSGALAALFHPDYGPVRAGLRTPTVLVAPSWGHPGKTAAHRSYQTIQGLSERLGLPITSPFAQGQEQQLADSLVRSQSGVVLICWEHKHIPVIASSLPVVSGTVIPRKWPGGRYDVIWSFTVIPEPGPVRYTFGQIPQQLLAGDTATVIPAGIDEP